jgi:hypothetical protein
MLELVDFALGVGLGALTYRAGMSRGAKARRKLDEVTDPKPICACSHNYAFHDENGVCHGVTTRQVKGDPILSPGGTYVVANRAGKTISEPCKCKRYTGPEPLPRYIP